jgi:threonylcarbamoyladenosine tRNA methylthiotransferase MtaB
MSTARVRILTLGCKVNQCDSDEIAQALAARGYDLAGRGETAATYIINTCTVTAVADAKARKLIRRMGREHPEATLIVTGCLAQREPFGLLDLPGVAAVVPNARKHLLPDLLPGLPRPLFPQTYLPSRTRAFIKIQDGCDHRCAYCAVPDARGAPKSKSLSQVLAEIGALAETGVQELVLCGIRLGAYGRERGGPSLAELLQQLRDLPIPRIRLSSIEPMDFDEDLLAAIADHPRLCHHLHLPLQAGEDRTLRAMKRSYTVAAFAQLCAQVRSVWADAALSTDVLVGFPGEREEDFTRGLEFIRAQQFTRLHVFPFSPRPGTPAAAYEEQVPAEVKQARTQHMLALGEELAGTAARAWLGVEVPVLFEQRRTDGLLTGYTPHYHQVQAAGPPEWVGRIVLVVPTREEHGNLYV